METEFAVENILFVTEYIQLKQVLVQKRALRDIINDLNLSYSIELPASTPTSIIAKKLSESIHNEPIKIEFIRASKQLFVKYIDPLTASLEVNIDSQLRYGLVEAFGILNSNNINKDEYTDGKVIEMVLPLLEQCATTVSTLMNDSLQRFKRTARFRRL